MKDYIQGKEAEEAVPLPRLRGDMGMVREKWHWEEVGYSLWGRKRAGHSLVTKQQQDTETDSDF